MTPAFRPNLCQLFLPLWIALLSLSLGACSGDGSGRHRIVLVTLDTLRGDSFLGSEERPTTMPLTLARAQADGRIFQRFYAATGTTQPSHASMLTGLHPWQHGLTRNGQHLDSGLETVAERLSAAGWSTGAVVASFPLASRFGFDQGFDHFHDDFGETLFARGRWEGQEVPAGRFFSIGESVTAAAGATLDRLEGDRQFLWVHYFDPHAPYGYSAGRPGPGPGAMMRRIRRGLPVGRQLLRARAAYDLDVAYLDRELDLLFERLSAAEGWTTHVVVATDHGESFGEHGSIGHGKRLTDEQLRVPAFILSPRAERGLDPTPAGSVDVAATLLALAGLPVLGEGRDLTAPPKPRQRPPSAAGMRRTFAGTAVEVRTTGREVPLDGHLFYWVDPEGRFYRGNTGQVSGPGARGDRGVELRSLFALFEALLTRASRDVPLDPETRKALEALGYVD